MNLTAGDLAHVAWFDETERAALRAAIARDTRPAQLHGVLLELDIAPVREMLQPGSRPVMRRSLAQPTAVEVRLSAQEISQVAHLDLPEEIRRSLHLPGRPG